MCRKCTHGSPVNHLLYPFRDSMAHFFALLMGSACAFVREMHQSVHLGQLKSSFGQCMTFCSARRPHRARRRLTKSHFELKSTHALRIPMASLPQASPSSSSLSSQNHSILKTISKCNSNTNWRRAGGRRGLAMDFPLSAVMALSAVL